MINEDDITLDLMRDWVTKNTFSKTNYNLIFLMLILNLLPIIPSIVEGTFFSFSVPNEINKKCIPLSTDVGFWSVVIVVVITCFFTINLFNNASKTFQKLWKGRIFTEEYNIEDYRAFLNKYELESNKKILYSLGIIITIIYWIGHSIILKSNFNSGNIMPQYLQFYPFTYSVTMIVGGLNAFLTGVLIWKIYILCKCISNFCIHNSKYIKLQPFNLDKCAGLGPLGKLCFNMSNILLSFGLYVILLTTVGFLRKDLTLIPSLYVLLLICIYFLSSSFLFFYPLLSAHKIMNSFKEDMSDKLNSELEKVYHYFLSGMGNGSIENMNIGFYRDNVQIIKNLKDLYLEIGKMPVWPINTETLIKFTSSISVPLIILIIEITITKLVI